MSVNVKISPLLRKFTNGQEIIEVPTNSPLECLHSVERQFPKIKKWLYNKHDELRLQVWFFINGERIYADELTRQLNDGDELFVLLAISGG
jgi:molybdopterin converting factor small subunit